jgi:Arc/MetJ-type ribon-helix-helix transcriptional regulator
MCHCMDMTRQKKMVSFALDPELIARLEAWLSKQEFPPSKTAVIEASLRAFLDEREKRR